MRHGSCPKCQSTDVYTAYAKSSLDAGIKEQPLLNLHTSKKGVFGDNYTLLDFDVYVCRQCGYVEQYVHDLASLTQRLPGASNWRKVGGA
jgi:predicted nucleic-acid-binding Zn-ribbon protein